MGERSTQLLDLLRTQLCLRAAGGKGGDDVAILVENGSSNMTVSGHKLFVV